MNDSASLDIARLRRSCAHCSLQQLCLPAGIDALFHSVANGKGAMPPRGGAAQASDADLRAAVEFMAAAAK